MKDFTELDIDSSENVDPENRSDHVSAVWCGLVHVIYIW